MNAFIHGAENIILTSAPFSSDVQHELFGKEIDRGPTLDGKTSVVIQGKRPGELVFKVLNEPFIYTPNQSSTAPYFSPSAEPVKQAA